MNLALITQIQQEISYNLYSSFELSCPLSSNTLIYAATAIFLVVLIIIISVRMRKKHSVKNRLHKAFKPYSRAELQNIIVPDGVGGLIDIEHLILLEQGLLIVELFPVSGNLFGADKIEQWTQMVNGRSFKFPNPLYRMQLLKQAVQVIAPSTPIFYRIVFTEPDSSFPKGQPEAVSILASLEEDLKRLEQEPIMTDKQRANWDTVLRIARKDGKAVMTKKI